MYIYTDTYTCNLASCQLSSTLPPHCWGIEQMFFFFFFFHCSCPETQLKSSIRFGSTRV